MLCNALAGVAYYRAGDRFQAERMYGDINELAFGLECNESYLQLPMTFEEAGRS